MSLLQVIIKELTIEEKMTLLLTAMDIIEFQTSEKLYIFVMLLYTLI